MSCLVPVQQEEEEEEAKSNSASLFDAEINRQTGRGQWRIDDKSERAR